jgi:hypothetical protein
MIVSQMTENIEMTILIINYLLKRIVGGAILEINQSYVIRME